MRLWSIHPCYLDRLALIACWRESLLAQKVLQNKTRAYKNHPQLDRFKIKNGLLFLSAYLWHLIQEATINREYNFNYNKILYSLNQIKKIYYEQLIVTDSQLAYEFKHLQKKLEKRDINKYQENNESFIYANGKIEANPVFKIVEGNIESWEKIK